MHFSEDPTIREFAPHVAATSTDPTALVWAVNASHAPSYWFPRQCPRAMAWLTGRTTADDHGRILGSTNSRVHVVEYGWLSRIQTTTVYAYRFDAADFEPYGDTADPHAYVASHAVHPLCQPQPIGDLLALHEEAGIELRLAHALWPWWQEVITSTVGFSGIRLRNATRP
jgi:hypothetical protein